MKIRTDFVTNSSSSNFTVTVTVESKNGPSYRFSRGPSPFDDVEWSDYDFHGDLSRLMKDSNARADVNSCLSELLSMEEDNYDKVLLKDTDQSADAIEDISVGDEVTLFPKKTGWDVFLDVMHNDKRIGVFPKQKGYDLGNWISRYIFGKKQVGAYKAKIVSVTPLSKQRKPTSPKVYVSVDLTLNDVTIPERGLDFESVEELCRYLSVNVSWGGQEKPDSRFVKNASAGIKNISDVSKIIVERTWDAWGEGADEYESGFGAKCDLHYVEKGKKAINEVEKRLWKDYGSYTLGIEHFELDTITGEYRADAYLKDE